MGRPRCPARPTPKGEERQQIPENDHNLHDIAHRPSPLKYPAGNDRAAIRAAMRPRGVDVRQSGSGSALIPAVR
jgi:hypothetical protein